MQHTTSQDIIKVALAQAVLFYMSRPKMMQPLIVIHVVRILKWPGIEASGFPTRTFKNNVSASKSSHPWGFVIFKSVASNRINTVTTLAYHLYAQCASSTATATTESQRGRWTRSCFYASLPRSASGALQRRENRPSDTSLTLARRSFSTSMK